MICFDLWGSIYHVDVLLHLCFQMLRLNLLEICVIVQSMSLLCKANPDYCSSSVGGNQPECLTSHYKHNSRYNNAADDNTNNEKDASFFGKIVNNVYTAIEDTLVKLVIGSNQKRAIEKKTETNTDFGHEPSLDDIMKSARQFAASIVRNMDDNELDEIAIEKLFGLESPQRDVDQDDSSL